jgi:hypothetical protein
VSGFEPLTVRLQGGLAGPHLSTAGHLSRALDGLATPGVQAHRLVSVVVVSAALAARRVAWTVSAAGMGVFNEA